MPVTERSLLQISRSGAALILLIMMLAAGCSVPGAAHKNGQGTSAASMVEQVVEQVVEQDRSTTPSAPGQAETPTETTSRMATETSTLAPTILLYFTPSPTHEAATPTSSPAPVVKFCSPLAGHSLADLKEILTNPFNPPPPGKDSGHHGVDFAYYRRGNRLSILGVQIQSVMAGRVAAVILNRIPYGNMAIVETSNTELPADLVGLLKIPAGQSLYLLYAHMNDAPLVALNSIVRCGQALGEVGNTPKGWSSDPHLHFETRIGPPGITFQGMDFYDTGATVEEMANYRRWRMSGDFAMFDPMLLLEYGLAQDGG